MNTPGLFFPLEYDRDREVQRLVSYLTDWVDTQRVYSSAFASITSPATYTSTVNPANFIHPSPSNVDYETFMSAGTTGIADVSLYKLALKSI